MGVVIELILQTQPTGPESLSDRRKYISNLLICSRTATE